MSCGFDDVENNCVLESGFYRKFSVAEDGEVKVEKPSCGGGRGGRSLRSGGLRRSYRSSSRFFCRPGRAYIDEESEAFAVMMSSKHNLFDRHGPLGRGSVLDLDICSPFWFYVTFLFIFLGVEFLANLMDFSIFGLLLLL